MACTVTCPTCSDSIVVPEIGASSRHRIDCPHCNQGMLVDDDIIAGAEIVCPNSECGRTMTMPESAGSPAPSRSSTSGMVEEQEEGSMPLWGKWLAVGFFALFGGVGAFLVGGVIIGLFTGELLDELDPIVANSLGIFGAVVLGGGVWYCAIGERIPSIQRRASIIGGIIGGIISWVPSTFPRLSAVGLWGVWLFLCLCELVCYVLLISGVLMLCVIVVGLRLEPDRRDHERFWRLLRYCIVVSDVAGIVFDERVSETFGGIRQFFYGSPCQRERGGRDS